MSLHLRYRREFLRFLAASPLMAYGLQEAWAQDPATAPLAKDVLSVMDFEALAKTKLPPAHWGYMASGVDDNLTLQANVASIRTQMEQPPAALEQRPAPVQADRPSRNRAE